MFDSLFNTIWNFVMFLLSSFNFYWVRLNNYLLTTAQGKIGPTSPQLHKIAIIGSGAAEGVGDYVVLYSTGGIAGRLRRVMAEKQATRMIWITRNLGWSRTLSEEWLPDKPLFKNFVEGPFGDAEIVFLMAGTEDFLQYDGTQVMEWEGEKTANNIKTICKELSRRGKTVFVSTLLAVGHSVNRTHMEQCNELIEKFVKSSGDANIRAGPRLHIKRISSVDHIYEGHPYPNRHGYRIIASECFECVSPLLKQIEWKHFKELLSFGGGEEISKESTSGVIDSTAATSSKKKK